MRRDSLDPLENHRKFLGVRFVDGLVVLFARFGAVVAFGELAVFRKHWSAGDSLDVSIAETQFEKGPGLRERRCGVRQQGAGIEHQ